MDWLIDCVGAPRAQRAAAGVVCVVSIYPSIYLYLWVFVSDSSIHIIIIIMYIENMWAGSSVILAPI